MTTAGVVDGYLLLGLRIGRHGDGIVDAYYGPAELAGAVDAEDPIDPRRLVDDAEELRADLAREALEPQRSRWLEAQVGALETFARRLAGEPISYGDEVERCYGIRPAWIPDEELRDARGLLASALPGEGPLPARREAWAKPQQVPVEVLPSLIDAVAAELRRRTADVFGLPDGEGVDFDLVEDEPWTGFNYYQGNLRSRVVLNVSRPMAAHALPAFVAHEAYPGHHTERVCKEHALVRGRGYDEEAIMLVPTPQALVSEGIAETGLETLLGDAVDDLVLELLAPYRLGYDAETVRAVRAASETLDAVLGNAALLVHEHGRSLEEAQAYCVEAAAVSRERAEGWVRFVTHPIWRAYAGTYVAGRDLCRCFVAGDRTRFRRLLTEQLPPQDLVAAQ